MEEPREGAARGALPSRTWWRAALLVAGLLLLGAMARLALGRLEPDRIAAGAAACNDGPPADPALTRRILLIILDGWQRRVAFDDFLMPRVASIAKRGSRGAVFTGVRTFTRGCIRELMTGRVSDLSDTTRNLFEGEVSDPSILTRASEAALPAALIDPTGDLQALFRHQVLPGLVAETPVAGLAQDSLDPAHDVLVEEAARIAWRRGARLLVAHLDDVDLSGHIDRPGTSAWGRVVRATDERIERLTGDLDLTRDTVFVIGDHGSDERGGHGSPQKLARETAYVAAGAGIRLGRSPLAPSDLADTLAILFGLCPPEGSLGAPEAGVLAIEPAELKRRCDRCLEARLRATTVRPTPEQSAGAVAYFSADLFTPEVAAAYRTAESIGEEEWPPKAFRLSGWGRWPAASVLIGALAVLISLLLVVSAPAPAGPLARIAAAAAVLLLGMTLRRDSAAVALLALLLAVLALQMRQRPAAAAAAAGAALLCLAAGFLPQPAPAAFDVWADRAGLAALLAAGIWIAPRVWRATRTGRAAPLVLTAIAASLAAPLLPGDDQSGAVHLSVLLVDWALAVAVLYLGAGIVFDEKAVAGAGALALAGCLFHGPPLVLVCLLAVAAAADLQRVSRVPAAIWAAAGGLAILRTVRGGYGYSNVDFSLSVVGLQDTGTIHYGWAAAVILASYLLPLALWAAVAESLTSASQGEGQRAVASLGASFLLFAGADLLFLSIPRLAVQQARVEEMFVFDVILGALAALLVLLDSLSALRSRVMARALVRAGLQEKSAR